MKIFKVLSEYTDPAEHIADTQREVESHDGPLYFITKNPSPLAQTFLDNSHRSIVHITLTGLGGSKLEPGAPKPRDVIPVINQLAPVLQDQLVVRIDPIIFGANHMKIFKIMRLLAPTVSRFKISYCSMYPFIKNRLTMLGLSVPAGFHYPCPEIAKHSKAVADLGALLGVSVEYCAPLPAVSQFIDTRIIPTGCVSAAEYERLGFPPIAPERKQRGHCKCAAKVEGLSQFKSCNHNCLYCYFSK